MRGPNTSQTVSRQRPPARPRATGTKKHGFSHPLMVELLEERLPLNMGPTVSMSSPPAPMASAPLAAAPATASTPPASASVADAAPISASGTPAALLFDPHQPVGMVPADVTSGSGPPL